MKPFIFILLAAISAQAQSLADVARSERARRAQLARSPTFTSQDVRGLSTPLSMIPATIPAEAAPAVPETPAAPATEPAEPVKPVGPELKFAQDLQTIRTKARELQDRETALQLQLNDLNNQFFAPVTDQNSQAAAQARIAETQKRLEDVRRELTDTRAKLQQMEVLGPK